jgi:hypothetical protein
MKTTMRTKPTKTFAATVGCALRRAGKVARKTARAYGTPVYYWRDGKVVAEKP